MEVEAAASDRTRVESLIESAMLLIFLLAMSPCHAIDNATTIGMYGLADEFIGMNGLMD